MPDAGQDIVERAIRRLGEADAVGRDDRQVERGRQIAQRVIAGFFVAEQVALQLEIHAVATEEADEAIDQPADAKARRVQHGPSAQRDEPDRRAVQIVERQRALSFSTPPRRRARWGPGDGRPHLHRGQQTTEIAISLLRLDEDGEAEDRVRDSHRQLRTDDGPDTGFFGREMHARRAVDAVAIEQCERRVAERDSPIDQRFRQRGAVEKRKCRRSVKLDVHGC